MGFVKFVFTILSFSLFVGCAHINAAQINENKGSLYEEGYRKGVSENINSSIEKLNGNDFPYIGGTWAEPIVQEVRIPAHVHGGVFYPDHNELVIITPGEWKRNNPFPIKSNQKEVSPLENNIDSVNAQVADITPMPNQFGKQGNSSVLHKGE